MFKEYLHVEKFGNDEVQNIELGVVYVFPKIDGTNASVWVIPNNPLCEDDSPLICAGSRTRLLKLEQDNAGFANWLVTESGKGKVVNGLMQWEDNQPRRIYDFLCKNSHLRLYGEWLVPHTFKGYRQEAWRQFYVFDVYNDRTEQYLSYDAYKSLLDEFGITYIPPLAIIKNGDYGRFLEHLSKNFFMIPDGGDPGEGIVLKNYDYQNKFGRQCFAKLIRNEFKEMHHREMGAPEINESKMNEERILEKVLSIHLVDKTIEKIRLATGAFNKKDIPRLFETVFYDIIREELWDSWKEIGFGSINGKTLKALVINKIKELKPEIFK